MLTHVQFYQLTEHIKQNKNTIEQEKMGRKDVARHATRHLDFEVAPSTVDRAVDVLGDNAPAIYNRLQNGSTSALNGVRSQVSRVRAAVRYLAKQLGEETAVADILNGVRSEATTQQPPPKG